MSAIFITATGTDIGKTYVATALIRRFRHEGLAVEALKPVATGFDPMRPEASDSGRLLEALGRPLSPEEIARVSPWRFAAPLSPDLAAAREGREIDFDALVEYTGAVMRALTRTLLVEGIGGAMVPLDARHTVLDWITALDVPVLLVTGSYLGSISHTLTCLEVLRSRKAAIRAVVVNETAGSSVSVTDTIASVSRHADTVPVTGLSRRGGANENNEIQDIIKLIQ